MAKRDWVFTHRLKQARAHKGVSQRRLGILVGIHADSASARINQYEHGKHEPDYGTVQRIAKVLEVPTAYFYAENDLMAELLVQLDACSDIVKRRLLRTLKNAARHDRRKSSIERSRA